MHMLAYTVALAIAIDQLTSSSPNDLIRYTKLTMPANTALLKF